MEGDHPVRLTVAEMTPDDVLAAVAFQERELATMTGHATPAVALLQRVADGESFGGGAGAVQQQTDRLRAAVRATRPAAAD